MEPCPDPLRQLAQLIIPCVLPKPNRIGGRDALSPLHLLPNPRQRRYLQAHTSSLFRPLIYRSPRIIPWYISPMILDVSTKHITPDTAIVAMSGALTLGTSLHAADTNLQNLIKAGTIKIVLDLSGVPYIDSAGLGAIVHAYGLAMEFHGKMRLCGINDKVASLLKMTRMDTFLAVDPDSATSLAALA